MSGGLKNLLWHLRNGVGTTAIFEALLVTAPFPGFIHKHLASTQRVSNSKPSLELGSLRNLTDAVTLLVLNLNDSAFCPYTICEKVPAHRNLVACYTMKEIGGIGAVVPESRPRLVSSPWSS